MFVAKEYIYMSITIIPILMVVPIILDAANERPTQVAGTLH